MFARKLTDEEHMEWRRIGKWLVKLFHHSRESRGKSLRIDPDHLQINSKV